MTSPSPLLFDTYYHIYNRGTNGENIFIEERNFQYFLDLFTRHVEPVCDLYAYCMLRNHFHMLIRVRSEEEIGNTRRVSKEPLGSDPRSAYPSTRFSNFFNAYAKAINKAYQRSGSLFQHPFGRVPITSDRQLWNVIAYIHQNPQKHGFVKDFRDWKYSSYGVLLAGDRTSLKRRDVLDWFGGQQEYLALHNDWVTDAQSRWFASEDRP